LYNTIFSKKYDKVKLIEQICSSGFYRSLFYILPSYTLFSTNFRTSNKFPGIYIGKVNLEIEKQGTVVGRQFGPGPRAPCAGGHLGTATATAAHASGCSARAHRARSPCPLSARWRGGRRRLGSQQTTRSWHEQEEGQWQNVEQGVEAAELTERQRGVKGLEAARRCKSDGGRGPPVLGAWKMSSGAVGWGRWCDQTWLGGCDEDGGRVGARSVA
jgi:hypothetical protein